MCEVESHFLETGPEAGVWVQATAFWENLGRERMKQEVERERCGLPWTKSTLAWTMGRMLEH